jgi:hypothetical protein
MMSILAVILSFCAGFWLSAQFHEKEFKLNNEFLRKLFTAKKKTTEAEKPKEISHMNDSPYSTTFNEGEV